LTKILYHLFLHRSTRSPKQRGQSSESPTEFLHPNHSNSTSSNTTPSPRRSAMSSGRHSTEDFDNQYDCPPQQQQQQQLQQQQQPSISNSSNSSMTNNTLSVPPVSYGAIPRTTNRTNPPQADQVESKRCFCGYFQEVRVPILFYIFTN
jgi:hypothetical protein